MPAKVNSKARDEADFWHRAYKPTVEIEYSDEEVVTPRLTPLIPGVQNHLRTLRSRTNTATAEPTPQTTSKLRKEADNTAAKKKAKVAAAAKKADQIVLCKKSGPCEKARVKHEAQGEPHICRCYDKKTPTSRIGFPRGDRTWKQKQTAGGHSGGCNKLAIGLALILLLVVALRYCRYI